jgi:hypothetical protein
MSRLDPLLNEENPAPTIEINVPPVFGPDKGDAERTVGPSIKAILVILMSEPHKKVFPSLETQTDCIVPAGNSFGVNCNISEEIQRAWIGGAEPTFTDKVATWRKLNP